jgi:hypothetical protein
VAACSSATVIAPRAHRSPIQYMAGVITRAITSAGESPSASAS